MTNSRLTDPEILEWRFPVVLEDFHIRPGSGGKGRWHAGDGTSRAIRFRERMDCALLTGHRRVRPFGLNGGEPGQLGRNSVRRLDGRQEVLQGCDQTVLEAGEAITIVTPTGGGYGPKNVGARLAPAIRAACVQSDPPPAQSGTDAPFHLSHWERSARSAG